MVLCMVSDLSLLRQKNKQEKGNAFISSQSKQKKPKKTSESDYEGAGVFV